MYDSDEEHGIELPGPWASSRDYIYNGDDAYDLGGSNDSLEYSSHGGKSGGVSGGGDKGGKDVSVGDYHSANKEYKEVSVLRDCC